MQDFKDKIAVVTGGGSGIGQGISRALAAEGAHIVVGDIQADNAEQAAEDLRGRGVRSLSVVTDVRDPASVEGLFDAAQSEFGGVDLVFNNAGVYLGGEMRDCTFDDWKFVLDVNVDAGLVAFKLIEFVEGWSAMGIDPASCGYAGMEERPNSGVTLALFKVNEATVESWNVYPFNSGYFMCLELKGVDAERLRVHLLDEYGIGLIATSATDVRVAFSCLELEQIQPLFETVHRAVQELS